MGQSESVPEGGRKMHYGEATFTLQTISVEGDIYEAAGEMGPNMFYTIKFKKIMHPHEIKEEKEKTKPEEKKLRFSSGIHFYEKASVKRIACDQLRSLEMHKERSIGNKERRYAVVRKLHKLGGWIREGRNKDRYYVEPNTPLPDYLLPPKPKKSTAQEINEINFM